MSDPHTDEVVIVERWRAVEDDVDDLRAVVAECASRLTHIEQEVDGLRSDVSEVLEVTRALVNEQREARKARHACIEQGWRAFGRAVELMLGDKWVRRGLVLIAVLLAAGIAGFASIAYNGDGLTIGQSAPAEKAEANRGAAGLQVAPQPTE